MQITLIKKKIFIQFPYDKTIVAELKNALPSKKFDYTTKTWETSVKYYDKVKVFGLKHLAEFNPAFIAYIPKEIPQVDNSQIAEQFKTHGINTILRPFQGHAAEFLILNPKSFLALPCGTGKTIISLSAANMFNSEWLIVTKATLKYNWQREVNKWFPHKTNNLIGGKNKLITSADFTIINYDLLDAYKDKLKFKNIIFDECHAIKNAKSKRTKAALKISKSADNLYLLSGTPIINRPFELVTQLKAIGKLDDFGGAHQFGLDFCSAEHNGFGWQYTGASNLDELYLRLKPFMYRATKEELLPELPPKQYIDVYLDLSNRKEYDAAHSDLVSYLKKSTADKEQFLLSIQHLNPQKHAQALWAWKQLHQYDRILAEQLVRIEKLKQLCVHGKLGAACDWIEDFLENDEKLVLFTHHKDIQQVLIDRFPAAVHIIGSDSLIDRDKAVQAFQNNKGIKLIVCSLKAASEGITLTAASNVAFLEYPWTPAEVEQAVSRVDRLTQTANSINIFNLIADKTIDNDIISLLSEKESVINNVLDGVSANNVDNSNILDDLVERLTK